MGKLPLSVAIITYNEEDRIGRTLEAVKDIASEIVVVDSHSTDRTREIAESYGAKVYVEDWKSYAGQKNYALEKCTQEWVLFLDADEVVSEELKRSIVKAVNSGRADAFYLNRKTYYLGKFLEHIWQPDWVLRLAKRSSDPKWVGGSVHERLEVKGRAEKLEGYLYHYTYRDLSDHFQKSLRYARLSAGDMFRGGKRFKLHKLVLNPVWAFLKQYFIKGGFRDGIRGLSVSMSYFFSTFLKYMFLWELEQEERRKGGRG
ncbi:glycosyltransferase family 2 protein [Hydrogenivirga sp. 128-5-R1-1]|uniref:glycosyltransferase family 2 protein n=1 Tax=Hydrogenivirga sp. 128-5-R1-1 TaxID=392423 RepID=UPI00015F36C7|nr:glycosyltransferase family 2 protein [Hydrogenivirga sp. 128-5-R1-1]EDP76515.1 beta 1,4 glucosyltransferase [Hydrogenivirga sp. 128-5-R1-1]